jgi:hypothetical protein
MKKLVNESLNERIGKNRAGKNLYEIVELDLAGRPTDSYGYFWASDEDEARQIAADYYDNPEIFTTGFYAAKESSLAELGRKRKELERKIASLKPLN